ncbi:MAG: hypothetical protein IID44_20050 [Planctomycetes bacterium]|nr:hypothetical protein [Planctomycetota bacterium]
MLRTHRLISAILLLALLFAAPAHAAKKKTGRRWLDMDYGPYLTATIQSSHPGKTVAQKGIAIKLGEEKDHYVVFDTDMLRYSVGWRGKFLSFRGVAFDGSHTTWPSVTGEQLWGNSLLPGWGKDGKFNDPRTEYKSAGITRGPPNPNLQPRGYGPLPRDWAKYKGLYLHGQKVILSYTVGKTDILEMPGLESSGELTVFSRTINIGKSTTDLTLQVLENAALKGDKGGPAAGHVVVLGDKKVTAVAVRGETKGLTWELTDKSQIRLHVPAASTPAKIQVLIASTDAEHLSDFRTLAKNPNPVKDLTAYTKGGPPRWDETVTTAGKLGADNVAYTSDVITAPTKNPWDAWMRFGGFDFFQGGKKAAICTWSGDVWTVDGIDDRLAKLSWRRIATGMYQPLGLKIVDGDIYVGCRDQITILRDLNGDGETDFYECFNNDHQVTEHFHEFAMDLQTDKNGDFYYAKSARHALDPVVPHHGTLLKVSKDGSRTEIVCNGFRAANGVGIGPGGEMMVSDQEGHWTPANRINLVHKGGFYGNLYSYHAGERTPEDGYDPPLVWLPKNFDRSPAAQLWVTSDRWGPLKGSMLHTSYGTGYISIVPYEIVDGVAQGGVIQMPGLQFPTGVMRGRFNEADGQLYVCGLSGWSSNRTYPGGFYRIRYTGKPVYLPVGIKATENGVSITFSGKLDKASAEDDGNYGVEQWNYRWTRNYGSAHFSVKNPKRKGQDEVEILSAELSADGKTVFLEIEDIQPVMQMKINLNIKAADGAAVKLVIHNTINKLGKGK